LNAISETSNGAAGFPEYGPPAHAAEICAPRITTATIPPKNLEFKLLSPLPDSDTSATMIPVAIAPVKNNKVLEQRVEPVIPAQLS
jgi:hypothetical protein